MTPLPPRPSPRLPPSVIIAAQGTVLVLAVMILLAMLRYTLALPTDPCQICEDAGRLCTTMPEYVWGSGP